MSYRDRPTTGSKNAAVIAAILVIVVIATIKFAKYMG